MTSRWRGESMRTMAVAVVACVVLGACGASDSASTPTTKSTTTTEVTTTTVEPTTTAEPRPTTTAMVELPQIALVKAPEMAEQLNGVADRADEGFATCQADPNGFSCRLELLSGVLLSAEYAAIAGGLLSNIEEVAPGTGPPASVTRADLDYVAELADKVRGCPAGQVCVSEAYDLLLAMQGLRITARMWAGL